MLALRRFQTATGRPSAAACPVTPTDPGLTLRVADCLHPGDVLLDVEVSRQPELFACVARHLAVRHGLAVAAVEHALARRERLGSTALGEGVAIPHARIEGVDEVVAAYLRLRQPLPFAAPDGLPVTHVLVLLAPKQAARAHLDILADATQRFGEQRFRERLQSGCDAAAVLRLFEAGRLARAWWKRPGGGAAVAR